MSQPILLSVVAGALAGVAGAGVVALAISPDAETSRSGAADSAALEVASLREEVSVLRQRNDDLASRLGDLELRPVVPLESSREAIASPEQIAAQAELEAKISELEELASFLRNPSSDAPVALYETVSTALEDIRVQEDAERDQRREERTQERLDERLTALSQTLGLDAYQSDELRGLYNDQRAKMNAKMEEIRDNGDFQGMRDAMREIRDESNTLIQGVLSSSQYEIYSELPRGESLFGGGGRGGFGGGGSGGFRGGI